MHREARESRLDGARAAAHDLVASLEADERISTVLMKAQELARLLRDDDAQRWLAFESNGYPSDTTTVGSLGHCAKYALRFYGNGKIFTASLLELEARVKAAEASLSSTQPATISAPVKDFLVAGATNTVLDRVQRQNETLRASFVGWSNNYQRHRQCVYRYAVDTLISIEFGDVAESVFETARSRVDRFVAERVPKGAEQLTAASERIRDGTDEGRSAALTACRRFLVSVADAVFPPRSAPFVDSKGVSRKVGAAEYKNRLLAFLASGAGRTATTVVAAELEHLAARLDALNDLASKGVHAEVSEAEAHLAIIHTYTLVAEVAQIPIAAIASDDAFPSPCRRRRTRRTS